MDDLPDQTSSVRSQAGVQAGGRIHANDTNIRIIRMLIRAIRIAYGRNCLTNSIARPNIPFGSLSVIPLTIEIPPPVRDNGAFDLEAYKIKPSLTAYAGSRRTSSTKPFRVWGDPTLGGNEIPFLQIVSASTVLAPPPVIAIPAGVLPPNPDSLIDSPAIENISW